MKTHILILSIILIIIASPLCLSASQPETSTPTPYMPIDHQNITFISSNYTLYGELYYPTNTSKTYPGIIICQGFKGYVDAYTWLPQALAQTGYVVLLFDYPGQGKSEGIFPVHGISIPSLNLYIRFGITIETPIQYIQGKWTTATADAITYLLNDSPVTTLLNTSSIGLIGHSLGAIAATKTATTDTRIQCIVLYTHTNPFIVDQINVPIQFQGGTNDLGYYSMPILSLAYTKAHTPKEVLMIKQGTHTGFTSQWGPLCPCPEWQKDVCLRYTQGWLDYFLKHDPNAYDVITTGDQNLSSIIKSRYNFGHGDIILQ